ncbi:MAG: hypothetical protein GIW99_09365 [Candidatus Eremiobacteraeota bacterium]|nr:hypothetical protein [Candidatus Eremiobacteraeota bacterium]MBC5827870.1 hypothetical protein [Candidatus Eremiobacteraeota bacterium]
MAYVIFVSVVLVISIIANWKIAQKSGYPGALSLLMLVPLVNLVVFVIFAFGEWPIQRELRTARGLGPVSS